MANMGILYMYLGRLQEAEVLLMQAKRMAPSLMIIDQFIRQLQLIQKRKSASGGNGSSFSER
jgi:Flp pilus assembly protein TadD